MPRLRSALNRRTFLAAATGLATGGGLRPAFAFPTQQIKLVVPFPPAGGTDVASRLIADIAGERMGQRILVENKPGANGALAGDSVVKSPADGHTLLVATAASFASAPALGQKLPYDVAKDFAPVAMIGLFPLVLNAAPQLGVKTVAELIALAKEKPGALNFASAGMGSTNHLVFEMIMQATGIKLTHVPYRGAAQAGQDLMTGQVQVMIDSLAASLGNIQGGNIVALGVTTETRQPQLPAVPSLKEQGVNVVYPGWASIVAPAGTPADVIAKLNAEINGALGDEKLRARYQTLVIEAAPWSADKTAAFMADDRAALTALVQKLGIKAEN